MINLHTHVLVHALKGNLKATELDILERNRWSVSAIVLWQVAKLVQLGRLEMDLGHPRVVRALSRIHVWPLDLAIARASTCLDFRSDPADEIIAATRVVHRVPLLTRDRTLRRSLVVPLAG